ncbi:MAG: hypothetical protein A3H96_11265 [Acidobacteria bacterium RIFCSPLOWO2_02_FULL_67_36]|nr:MAG: hypothetical protein A3H96_11265 [Acidobacteria bacterium RIFCSPLOWO2_02_FULL_67_36]OFW23977.1 MAG: hypothetical protein A3G21_03635 [Acidobacteria bacterium RIFCSPLOWO2_12_FULL_66_21]
MTDDARLASYAAARQLSLTAARAELVTIALDHLDARRRGAAASLRGTTKAERSAKARVAGQARWARARAR